MIENKAWFADEHIAMGSRQTQSRVWFPRSPTRQEQKNGMDPTVLKTLQSGYTDTIQLVVLTVMLRSFPYQSNHLLGSIICYEISDATTIYCSTNIVTERVIPRLLSF